LSLPTQSFLPVIWLGGYSFLFGPNIISYDQETSIALHPILGGHEQPEAVGYTAQKLSMSGFLFSLDNKALTDMLQFQLANINSQYVNRPVSVGVFTQDAGTWPSANSSSQLWFNEVGYLSGIHFDFQGGRANYKYPFRFNFIEEQPLIRVPTTTPIATETFQYQFSTASFTDPVSGIAYTSLPPGYFTAVEVTSTASGIGTNTGAQSITSFVDDTTSTTLGSGPLLGRGSNLLFQGNPLNVLSGSSVAGVNSPSLKMPLTDGLLGVNGRQSIRIAASTTDIYRVVFGVKWAPGAFLPFGINLVYVPVA
jgi:hypothetical protein